jgi:superfamily II RNA helicase
MADLKTIGKWTGAGLGALLAAYITCSATVSSAEWFDNWLNQKYRQQAHRTVNIDSNPNRTKSPRNLGQITQVGSIPIYNLNDSYSAFNLNKNGELEVVDTSLRVKLDDVLESYFSSPNTTK